MTDGIESKRGLSAQLPRVRVTSSEQQQANPESKAAAPKSEADGVAIRISFSGLGRTIQNNTQASASLNKISSQNSTSASRADARRDVEQANRSASEASVSEVEDLANSVAEAISDSPEEAMNAFSGGSYRAADLLKY